jgi:hypothetical protein
MTLEDKYYIEVELAVVSYMPKRLKSGMKFLSKINVGLIESELNYFTLDAVPEDEDAFMSVHGAPVKLYLIDGNDNYPFASQDEFGWLYGDEGTVPLTEVMINKIINNDEGFLKLHCDSEGNVLYNEGKITISFMDFDDEEDLEDES